MSETKTGAGPRDVVGDALPELARIGQATVSALDRIQEQGAHLEALPIPSLPAKPGWKTVEAHMALLFTVVAAMAALLGYRNVTPERLQNSYELIMGLVTTFGPLLAAGGVVWNLITSRGKFESNKVNATAAIVQAQNQSFPQRVQEGIQGLGGFKDPSTWINLGRTIGTSGAIPGKAGDVIGSILGGRGGGSSQARTQYDDATLDELFKALQGYAEQDSKALQSVHERLTKVEDFIRLPPKAQT